jgi:hypothetical protein
MATSEKSKFSLADVFALLAALVFGFVCFLSINFYTLGDKTASIAWASAIALTLFALAMAAKFVRGTVSKIFEVPALVLFTAAFGYCAYSQFPHYFTVWGQKKEIQRKLDAGITQAKNMFEAYKKYADERTDSYKRYLDGVVAAKNTKSTEYAEVFDAAGSRSADEQIDDKIFNLEVDLYPSNYKATDSIAAGWLADARDIVKNWKPIDIVGVVTDIDKYSNEWLSSLVEFSSKRQKAGNREEDAEDFSYTLSFEDAKGYFTAHGAVPSPLAIGLAVLLYACMLLSYIIAATSSKRVSAEEKKHRSITDVHIPLS